MLLGGGAVALVAVGFAIDAISIGWPLVNREVAFVRAAAAGIALGGGAPDRRAACGAGRRTAGSSPSALAVAAVMAFAAFYNLGRPQFWNHAENRPEFVHTNDLRVYQPFAKYFKELGYDGVYLASVLAYAEDRRGGSLDSMGMQELRGLGRPPACGACASIKDDILEVRTRFSDARWAEFKKDMNFFRMCRDRNTFPPSPTTAPTPRPCGSSSRGCCSRTRPPPTGC